MTRARPIASYKDAENILEQALQENGLSICCADHAAAITLRHRLNRYRVLDRISWTEINHGVQKGSPFDNLVISIPPKNSPLDHVISIRPRATSDYILAPLGSITPDSPRPVAVQPPESTGLVIDAPEPDRATQALLTEADIDAALGLQEEPSS